MKAIDVANFFVDYSNEDPQGCLTNLALNKLLYFAQGWHLAKYGIPLFEEDIQAWDLGPVVPSVYSTFKVCEKDRIASTFGNYDPSIIDERTLDLLLDIEYNYGKYTASALVNMTHEKDSPWSKVYIKDKKGIIITKDSMEKYFSNKELPHYLDSIQIDDIITKRNSDGILILPKEFDE